MHNERRYLNLLLAYGDHKWRCHTAKDLRADTKNVRECNCGWAEIRVTLQKTEKVTAPAPSTPEVT